MSKHLITVALASLLGGGVGGFVVHQMQEKSDVTTLTDSKARQTNWDPFSSSQTARQSAVPIDFTAAAERSMNAVVHISTTGKKASAYEQSGSENSPWGELFSDPRFRRFYGEGAPTGGTGSGVIYRTNGYIITNNHVVENADKITVTLHDNRKFEATLVGTYPKSDIAVIKIDQDQLPTLRLGNSDGVKVGEWVLAVGNPFDLTSTVTAGIVSAKGRNLRIIGARDAIESFIQTDAAVNPGNRGGALVDAQGQLIGINSAIKSETGSFAGYSFAIPIDLASRIADDIIQNGSYQRPYLGVSIYDLDQEAAKELGVTTIQGVVIEALEDGGSAQYAGLQPKDVIVAVDGKTIKSVPELQEMIGRARVGDEVSLSILRKGKSKDISVLLKSIK